MGAVAFPAQSDGPRLAVIKTEIWPLGKLGSEPFEADDTMNPSSEHTFRAFRTRSDAKRSIHQSTTAACRFSHADHAWPTEVRKNPEGSR